MDAESPFTGQYSTNWTTPPVSHLSVRNRSSTSSSPNLRRNSTSSSAMLNAPIPRNSPSMSHPISSSVDSHSLLQPFMSSELSNVFSTPLDPDSFSALAASGMLSQPPHPTSNSIRNPYAVQPSPFLSTPASHIVDGQYSSKLSSYPHTIPNTEPQIKPKQTIVRRIAYFLSFMYSPLRRSSKLTRRSLTRMPRTTSMLAQLRCRIDLSMAGHQAPLPLRPPTTTSLPLTALITTPSAPTSASLLPCGCPLPPLPHLRPGSPIRCPTIL